MFRVKATFLEKLSVHYWNDLGIGYDYAPSPNVMYYEDIRSVKTKNKNKQSA